MTPPTRFLADLPPEGGPYAPSQFRGDFLNEHHRRIRERVDSVPGKLRTADELKLYEMAYMARGPILEIGTDQGRSLAIMAMAARDSGSSEPLYSVEVLEASLEKAKRNLEGLGVFEFVTLIAGDSATIVSEATARFDLVFVDGDHTSTGVKRDLEALQGKVDTGGAVMFHDYFDPRNDDPDEPAYGVRQAVEEMQEPNRLRYRGGCGAIGVFEQA